MPSSTKGATTLAWRNPVTKVVVFQWPCGAALTGRSPRGARHWGRAITVDV